jgi:hypothetical protein
MAANQANAMQAEIEGTTAGILSQRPKEVLATRQLFGGAITCEIPASYIDVSDFRKVPDNQECFADPDTDRSILIDILELCDGGPRELFTHIAEMNDANDPGMSTIVGVETLSSDVVPQQASTAVPCTAFGLVGTQNVSKFHESAEARNHVVIYLGDIRLPQFATDIVVTHNVPTQFDPRSSSATACFIPNEEHPGQNEFLQALNTFRIVDPGLFTPSDTPHN